MLVQLAEGICGFNCGTIRKGRVCGYPPPELDILQKLYYLCKGD